MYFARISLFTAVIMEIRPTMSDVTLCSRVEFHRRFGEVYCLRHLGLRLSEAFRTSVEFYRTTWFYSTESRALPSKKCEGLKQLYFIRRLLYSDFAGFIRSFILKFEAVYSTEISMKIYGTFWRYISDDHTNFVAIICNNLGEHITSSLQNKIY